MEGVGRFILKSFSFSLMFTTVFLGFAIALVVISKRLKGEKNRRSEATQVLAQQRAKDNIGEREAEYKKQLSEQESYAKRAEALMSRSEANMTLTEEIVRRERAWIEQKEANLKREAAILAEQQRQLEMKVME
ncbi:hypothetical protein SAMN05444172_8971 [Burkholderia sp. GAS332]|nr:hypothetical protein SAMN05444172_8971 [Burkholderia sp. GAS332]